MKTLASYFQKRYISSKGEGKKNFVEPLKIKYHYYLCLCTNVAHFQHNTRYIHFDGFRDIKKQKVNITLIIVKYSPK